ncbi:MAG: hypothetical protein MUP44_13275 [Anaerolineales bacterium]|nr:hypothetical protein [Anaerolineales bacterium]
MSSSVDANHAATERFAAPQIPLRFAPCGDALRGAQSGTGTSAKMDEMYGEICFLGCKMEMWELPAMDQTPAPLLARLARFSSIYGQR